MTTVGVVCPECGHVPSLVVETDRAGRQTLRCWDEWCRHEWTLERTR